MELKQIWENKLTASKAIDPIVDPAESSLQNKVQQSEFFFFQVLFSPSISTLM
jgi:hypothetical protein